MSTPMQRWSLAGQLALTLLPMLFLGIAMALVLERLTEDPYLAGAVTALLCGALFFLLIHRRLRSLNSLFRALSGMVDTYRDGDFSSTVAWASRDELGELVAAHNQLGAVLREQRLALSQRELLLDTMVQNTPVAMLLIAQRGNVVFGNLAARKLLAKGRRLEGVLLEDLLRAARPELAEAIGRGGDGVFSVTDQEEEVFHLSRRGFRLNGRDHELLLLRRLTQELRRQEVQTWKKVIRVMSHEMNNALGPISSLARSGAELVRRGESQRLLPVLATIGERAQHLDQFLRGYAQFAKLPTPRLALTDWTKILDPLRHQFGVNLLIESAPLPLSVDSAQIGQALSNLISNAVDAGSAHAAIDIQARALGDCWRLDVCDRGSGMSEEVMARALTPFYSTKRSGTGLGLALVREIIEAHGGRIALANRTDGGLQVSIELPQSPAGRRPADR